ncbi:hypothetical protein BsWGS_11021 [Bradybaena similaris]
MDLHYHLYYFRITFRAQVPCVSPGLPHGSPLSPVPFQDHVQGTSSNMCQSWITTVVLSPITCTISGSRSGDKFQHLQMTFSFIAQCRTHRQCVQMFRKHCM